MSQSTGRALLLSGAIAVTALFLAGAIYLFRLNGRMSAEIVAAPWRNPTEIVSVPRGADSEPVVRVYGDDWRVTQPLRLADLTPGICSASLFSILRDLITPQPEWQNL